MLMHDRDHLQNKAQFYAKRDGVLLDGLKLRC